MHVIYNNYNTVIFAFAATDTHSFQSFFYFFFIIQIFTVALKNTFDRKMTFFLSNIYRLLFFDKKTKNISFKKKGSYKKRVFSLNIYKTKRYFCSAALHNIKSTCTARL